MKKKKKKQLGVDKTHVHLRMGIFVPPDASFSLRNFLPILKRKQPGPIISFPSLSLPAKYSPKSFTFSFSHPFFFLPKIHCTKHSLRVAQTNPLIVL